MENRNKQPFPRLQGRRKICEEKTTFSLQHLNEGSQQWIYEFHTEFNGWNLDAQRKSEKDYNAQRKFEKN